MRHKKTPLIDALLQHREKTPISFHVPGHKNGNVFSRKDSLAFKEMLKLDVTELPGLDDLHDPEGVIYEAQQLLAEVYSVRRSFFLVNGTTVGVLAMIMATVNEKDTVLVQRNCHKSVQNGLRLTNAKPVFLNPDYDQEWNIAGGVSFKTVQEAINNHPEAKALILTYPNYYGMVYELDRIIELAHEHHIPVLVDEAHGAHFIAANQRGFPLSATVLGADVIVQSAHKTLPAMTMGSFLHVNSNLVSDSLINQFLHILQSSSPSYPIMASLDAARSYVGTYNDDDLIYLQTKIAQFRQQLSLIEGIKVLDYPNGQGDLLKITIQSTDGLTGFELQEKLIQSGIYPELADSFNVLLVAPLIKKNHDYSFDDVIKRIKNTLQYSNGGKASLKKIRFPSKERSQLVLSYKEMNNRKKSMISLNDAIGRIAAEMVIPYPPGIPLLFPGEMITAEDIEAIKWLIEKGTHFQGGKALKQGSIQVF